MFRRAGLAFVVSVLTIIGLMVPAAPAAAASPAVMATDAYVELPPYEYNILISGTVTCSQPTGQQQIYVQVIQSYPWIAGGADWVLVNCSGGSQYWYGYVGSSLNLWNKGSQVSVTVTLYRGGTQEAQSSTTLTSL